MHTTLQPYTTVHNTRHYLVQVFDLAAPTPVPNGVKEKKLEKEDVRKGKEEVERNNNTRKRAAPPVIEVVNLYIWGCIAV